jgi:hypothetical protein
MTKNLKTSMLAIAAAFTALTLSLPAMAQDSGQSAAPLPRTMSASARLIPVAGASSFGTSTSNAYNNYDQGFSAGLLADFGADVWTFETGILSLNGQANRVDNNAIVSINSWGIPLLAKVNFSGHPLSTIFAKAGVLPFTLTSQNNEFNWMGVAGLGAAIPLGRNTSLTLDASYEHIINNSSTFSNDYQGVSLLAGLAFNI